MSVHKTSAKCKLSYIVISFVFILSIGIAAFLGQLSKHIDEISEYKGREAANDAINASVESQLSQFSNTEFITVSRDADGKITSINTNSTEVNNVSNRISDSINERLKSIENENIEVPIGTLSGVTLFTGRGFDIDLKLHQIGAVSTQMKSEFVSAGINQTKYRLYIEITVEMKAILPAHSTDISLKNEFLVSETVIVGEVPKMYLCQ